MTHPREVKIYVPVHTNCVISSLYCTKEKNAFKLDATPINDYLFFHFTSLNSTSLICCPNRIDQLVQISWFLARYQAWWIVKRVTLVVGVDFGVLILRICSYTL